MALLLHYTGQDYTSRGLLNTKLIPGSTSAFADGCKTGKGFAFDGTANSAFEINELTDSEKFSIDFWYYTGANVTEQQTIFSDYSQLKGRINICAFNGSFSAFVYNTSDVFSVVTSGNIVINTWYHVAVTVDTIGNIRIYLNGVLQLQLAIKGTVKSSSGLYSIGKRYTNGNLLLTGTKICNFKLYNHALSAREIAEDYKSLMLHYKLDKPITTQVFDHSGFNRHITVIENTTTNSTTEKRVYGGSLANDGAQGLYGSLNLSELNGINEISVAVRFRFISQVGSHCYFSSRTTTGNNGINLFKLGGSSRDVYVDIAGRNAITLPYDLVAGTWYDFVAVKSTIDVRLYINGVLVGSVPNTNSISGTGQLYVAISRSIADNLLPLQNPMNGNVQDIRFYAKALTQEDVTELYQTRHMVDKSSNCYTYELIEGQTTVGMNKQGQLLCDEIIEDGTFQIVSNKKLKIKEIKEI